MKKLILISILTIYCLVLFGCAPANSQVDVAATTLPVYEFTQWICQGTGITTGRIVTQEVSCLHDYTLQVSQMRMVEGADVVIISGAGLEGFLEDAMNASHTIIDASVNIPLLCGEEHDHDHAHTHTDHSHESEDPHFWLSAQNAITMADNICQGLCQIYPQHRTVFEANLSSLVTELIILDQYGKAQLEHIQNKEIITFHDGFAYLATQYGLRVLRAIEEEAGSEASAAELIELIELINSHDLPAIFTEKSGSTSAADIIRDETGVKIFTLDMAMAGDSYFDAMYHNIDTLKEALG